MSIVQLDGIVDEHHRLTVEVPGSVSPGPVRIIIVPAGTEEAENRAWLAFVNEAWSDWLDPREDIYTLEDGKPVDGPR